MTRLALAGATDAAEVALFDPDALSGSRDQLDVATLEKNQFILRIPTGSDGEFLLHAYVGEPIPPAVMKFCSSGAGDATEGNLCLSSGRLGFGGIEMVLEEAGTTRFVPSHGPVPPAVYSVIAYRTEYPDAMIESAVRESLGLRSHRLLELPGYLIAGGLLAVVGLVFVGGIVVAGVGATIIAIAISRYLASPMLKNLQRLRREAEMEFPSVVAQFTPL